MSKQIILMSKLYLNVNHHATSVDMTIDKANKFIKCIEKGGIGSKAGIFGL